MSKMFNPPFISFDLFLNTVISGVFNKNDEPQNGVVHQVRAAGPNTSKTLQLC
jgi:hypothetical protein